MSMSARARQLRASAAVIGAVAAVGAAVLAFASPAAAAAAITVTPHSGLSDGQTVTVKGTGFKANTSLVVIECPTNATGSNGGSVCDVNDGKIGITSDGNGAFSTTLTVKVKPSSSVDCTKQGCLIQAHEGFNPNSGQTATAPISFGSAGGGSSSSAPSSTTSAASGGTTTSAPPATGGGAGSVPTGANTGHATTAGVLPMIAEVLAALAVVLVGASLALHRRRTRN